MDSSREDVIGATCNWPGEPQRQATLADLMVEWQETGSHAAFDSLVARIRSRLTQVIAATLLSKGIHDPAAVDDALSLVLDHLRRLAGGGRDDREVGKFAPARAFRAKDDPGWGYLSQLARGRAGDVARDRRRQSRVFSQLELGGRERFEQVIPDDGPDGPAAASLTERLRAAAQQLEPRERLLVELLLDGKSQALIAHVLDVSEGTVSRLRARVIRSLRRLLRP
jgi:RNA polymerase sigma factor (sigma-70 family)